MNVDEIVQQAGERLAARPVAVPSFERLEQAARQRRQAVAGVLTVAVLAVTTVGAWAILDGDSSTIRSSESTTAPTTPAPTSPIASTTLPADDASSAPTTLSEALAPENSIAILDPILGIGPAYSQGEAGRYLYGSQPATHVALRRNVDGSVSGAMSWTFRPGVDTTGQNPAWTDVPLADGRAATRYEEPPRVSYSLQLNAGYVTASISTAAEPDLLAWIETLPADAAIDTLTPPLGYEPLPAVKATLGVMYFRDEADAAGAIGQTWKASVLTNQLVAETALADWVAARYEGAAEPIGTNGALIVGNADARTVVWQPDPRVVVEMFGPEANLAAFVDALRVVRDDDADLVPTAATIGGYPIEEQAVTRSVLGETSTGRFAYVQYRDDDRACFSFTHTGIGGYGSCDPPVVQPLCLTSNSGTTWTAAVIVLDRTAAEVTLEVDGVSIKGTTEQGAALDGTPWVFWSATDIGNGPDPTMFPGTLTVDGTPCSPWL